MFILNAISLRYTYNTYNCISATNSHQEAKQIQGAAADSLGDETAKFGKYMYEPHKFKSLVYTKLLVQILVHVHVSAVVEGPP